MYTRHYLQNTGLVGMILGSSLWFYGIIIPSLITARWSLEGYRHAALVWGMVLMVVGDALILGGRLFPDTVPPPKPLRGSELGPDDDGWSVGGM